MGATLLVWEGGILEEFFSSLIGDELSCANFSYLFFGKHTKCEKQFMEHIYDQLPTMEFGKNKKHTGFVAMSENLNKAKAEMFKNGGKGSYDGPMEPLEALINLPDMGWTPKSIKVILKKLFQIRMILDMFNTNEDIKNAHNATNHRMYNTFLSLDKQIKSRNINKTDGTPITVQLGPRYKKWYTEYLQTVGPSAWEWSEAALEYLQKMGSCNGWPDPRLEKAVDVWVKRDSRQKSNYRYVFSYFDLSKIALRSFDSQLRV